MSPIHHMDILRYYKDRRPWDVEKINSPSWEDVEKAVRQMDDLLFPIVELHIEADNSETAFLIIGGAGYWALLNFMGDWEYEDPQGSEKEIHLWKSDQGYYCSQKNTLQDIEKVLKIVHLFFRSGSYSDLNDCLLGIL